MAAQTRTQNKHGTKKRSKPASPCRAALSPLLGDVGLVKTRASSPGLPARGAPRARERSCARHGTVACPPAAFFPHGHDGCKLTCIKGLVRPPDRVWDSYPLGAPTHETTVCALKLGLSDKSY